MSLKTSLALFFVILTATTVFAEDHQLILWTRGKFVTPWYFYTGRHLTAEARYNLDQEKTATVCLGKQIGKESFSVNPEACGYVGKENGYGPEVWVLSETSKSSITSYVQYAKFKKTSAFGYAWFQQETKVTKHVGLGGGVQLFKEGKSGVDFDLGPSVKVRTGKLMFNVLPMWRTTPTDRGKLTISSGIFLEF